MMRSPGSRKDKCQVDRGHAGRDDDRSRPILQLGQRVGQNVRVSDYPNGCSHNPLAGQKPSKVKLLDK